MTTPINMFLVAVALLLLSGCQSNGQYERQAAEEHRRCMGAVWAARNVDRHPHDPRISFPSVQDICRSVKLHVAKTGQAVSYDGIR